MKVSVYALIALAANMLVANANETMQPEVVGAQAAPAHDEHAAAATHDEHAAANPAATHEEHKASTEATTHEKAKTTGKKKRRVKGHKGHHHHHHAASCESTIKHSRNKVADEATCCAERAYEGQWANRGVPAAVVEAEVEKKD